MLLVIDIGNTQAACGLFRGKRLVKEWRVPTREPAARIANAVMNAIPKREIEGVCISSVVPRADRALAGLGRKLGCDVLFATNATCGVSIVKAIKEEVGADRLVNAVAAYERYHRPIIIVDFGTATTFDVVTGKGEYAGGAIAPGVHLANRSLSDCTAKLPAVPVKKTRKVIATNTQESMQAGVFHGYVGLTNHLIAKIKKDMGGRPMVIATGGLATLVASSTDVIEHVHPNLTLEGLRIVWERNLR